MGGGKVHKKKKQVSKDINHLDNEIRALTTGVKSLRTEVRGKRASPGLMLAKGKKKRVNYYLLALLDPFNYKYLLPDKFTGMTKVFDQLMIIDIPFDSNMEALVHVFPNLGFHAQVTKGSGGLENFVFQDLTKQGNFLVKHAYVQEGKDPATVQSIYNIAQTVGMAINHVVNTTPQYWAIDSAACVDGCTNIGLKKTEPATPVPNHYGIHFSGNASNMITFNCGWTLGAVASHTVDFYVTTNLGVRTASATLTTGQLSCQVSVNLLVGDTSITSLGIGATGSARTVQFINVYGYLDTSDSYSTLLTHAVPEFSQISNDYLEARCVAMAAWFEPTMASLDNGGEITSKLVEGGSATNYVHFDSFDAIAGASGSATRKVKTGAYVIWRPTQQIDYDFKGVYDASGPDNTHISTAIKVTKAAGESVLLKVASVWEGKTNKRYLGPENSVYDQRMFQDATNKIASFPLILENDSHLETIGKWLRGTAHDVGQIGSVVGGGLLAASPLAGPFAPEIAAAGAALVGVGTGLKAV